MNTFTLAGKSLDAKNNPAYAGRYMVFRITSVGSDTAGGASYPRESVDMLIAADGTFGGDLWVNGDSGVECLYEVIEPSGQRLELIFPSAVDGTTVRYEFALENYLASASASQQTPGLAAHIADTNNPHQVDSSDVGLSALDSVTFSNITAETDSDPFVMVYDKSTSQFKTKLLQNNSIGKLVASADDSNDVTAMSWDLSGNITVQQPLTLATDLAITEGGTGASTASAALVNLGVQTATGGVTAGQGATASSGGAVGNFASATTGGAVGADAIASTGGAVGETALASSGGAVGYAATATTGFAGGANAVANGSGRVQLGAGTNSTDSTIQFLSSGSVTATEFGTLAGTTASYTTAEETKLAGIEALADVTDATNVAAAGGYVAGGTDVAIADGGTGASTAASALTNLGIISATATLDFPSIASNSVAVLTMTVTGAAVGDAVMLGAPSTIEADLTWTGFVSAADTVSIRLHHTSGSAIDPASATWRATVVKY